MGKDTVLNIALSAIHGRKVGEYSSKETSDALREAFIEMNGGSTKINPKTLYRGSELYTLIETIVPAMIDEGIKSDSALMELVEYINIADGDENEFRTQGDTEFIVATSANGIQGVRRQRITDGSTVTVKTVTKSARVYDEFSRFMAKRIDFNDLVEGVARAFKKAMALDAYHCLEGITANTAGLNSTYVKSGSFDEDELIALIEHVEAATGEKAKIIGTKAALKKVTTAVVSEKAKEDIYNFGYYGSFNGTPMIQIAQVHKPGTDVFALAQDKLWIVASDDKPVKVVNEGEGYMYEKPSTDNADLTQEYVYIQNIGTAVICAKKLGVKTIS